MSDEQAEFAAYFRVRRDIVRRTAYLLCGDWHFAEDLAQLAFLRLAGNWRKIRDHGALDAYVHTILIRTYLAESRRWFRRRERLTGDFSGLATVAGSATDAVDDLDGRIAMATALRALPPRQRTVVIARYYADLDVAATAQAMGCSVGTVKSHTSRAVAALRTRLIDFDVTLDEEVSSATSPSA